jgi:DNA polymerase-3 subunit delta'
MSTLARVLGQPSAVATLERALSTGRVAQAYLFAGPGGVGKSLAAQALAQAALCCEAPGRGCGQCTHCTRIAQGTHPDVRVFAPRDEGHRNLQVETLREEVLPFTRFAPFEAARAFLIFPEADVSFPEHHAEAANALLKTLEEPRAQVHFVLTSDRPERLLPTILLALEDGLGTGLRRHRRREPALARGSYVLSYPGHLRGLRIAGRRDRVRHREERTQLVRIDVAEERA